MFFAENRKKPKVDEIFQNINPYDRLCHIIEIEERNEITLLFYN